MNVDINTIQRLSVVLLEKIYIMSGVLVVCLHVPNFLAVKICLLLSQVVSYTNGNIIDVSEDFDVFNSFSPIPDKFDPIHSK